MIQSMHPYLVLNGNGQEAIKFYANALDANLLGIQTFVEMPASLDHTIPEDARNRVLNAHLKVGDTDLMLSDTFSGMPYQIDSHVTIALIINDQDKTREVFAKLQEGGKIIMELQKTFWSPLYG
jgi:PhnB protein